MSFTPIKFLGATVRGVNSSIGWGTGAAGQVRVSLVEDHAAGDLFLPDRTGAGQPVLFQAGGFRFGGLLQSWEEKDAIDGRPVYEVNVVDPREVLEGTQVVTGGFGGVTSIVPNVLNPYGWYENQGYGSSLANETGMPWPLVRNALNAIASSPVQGDYGGPLVYRGFPYSLDLSRLPSAPIDYRVPGPFVGLLELIATVCEDGGFDFFVDLFANRIVVRTVSRRVQPPLGTVATLVHSGALGEVLRSGNGLECRNELTSSMLIGGEVAQIHLVDQTGLTQFWGYDVDGNPITGTTDAFNFTDAKGKVIDSVETDYFTLNGSPVADITGSTGYDCTTLELRLAKVDYDSWALWVIRYKPRLAKAVGLTGGYDVTDDLPDSPLPTDLKGDGVTNATSLASEIARGDLHIKEMRLYEFVRGYAEEYLGRKFLVSLPFVLTKQDPETLRVTNSYDVHDGGYLPEGAAPLNLSDLNEDIFRTQDGRLVCFVRFDDVSGVDLSRVSPQGSVLQDDSLFVQAQADPLVVFAPSPSALVTLPSAVSEMATDTVGDLQVVAGLAGMTQAQATNAIQNRTFGLFNTPCAPETRVPAAAAVPLRSNTLTYGPWFIAGPAGKTRVEQDPGLTPWQYGGYDAMNRAGLARVSESVSFQQLSELGDVEVAGLPIGGLGDILIEGGPAVTNIDISVGTQGFTTRYRFQTYTQRFGYSGVFSKGASERIRRVGSTAQELRRSLRAQFRESQARSETQAIASQAAGFLERAPARVKGKTPHDCLIGYSFNTGSGVRVGVATATFDEAITFSRANDPSGWKSTGAMSFGGLVRPFSTNPTPSGVTNLPTYRNSDQDNGGGPGRTLLDPWKARNDVEVYAWGDTYKGLAAWRRSPEFANSRPMALRGPLVVAGWGFGVQGDRVPGTGTVAGGDSRWAPDDYMVRSSGWPVAPVDLLYDRYRNVWTNNTLVFGTLANGIMPKNSGLLTVNYFNGPAVDLLVWNNFSKGIGSGTNASALYVSNQNRLMVMNADCTGG